MGPIEDGELEFEARRRLQRQLTNQRLRERQPSRDAGAMLLQVRYTRLSELFGARA